MAAGGSLLQQREITDLLLAYLPAIDAARGAMRVCRAWHEAVRRVHGKMIAIVGVAMKRGGCLVFRGHRRTYAAMLIQYYHPATFYGNVELGYMTVQFHVLLQQQPLLLRTVTDKSSTDTKRYQPLLKPNIHEQGAENIYYQLTGIDLRSL